ncbi:hypothetical protein J1N35_012272 [Gossypium stocksii]|uniref:Uncharacterized protein n=1 Tax=Gossypium stocksii TaxID=47602 RepID=A0A9D3W3L7_9ROSI|nr:hypothetical protein J1N35_012272 [Gossypium stocksii]
MEDLSHSSRQNRPLWEKILKNIVDISTPGRSSEDALTEKNGRMMAKVATALAAVGITICACVAEIDRGRGMAVMLFHVEANLELVNACSRLDLILGVLGWSVGCSWPSTIENNQL